MAGRFNQSCWLVVSYVRGCCGVLIPTNRARGDSRGYGLPWVKDTGYCGHCGIIAGGGQCGVISGGVDYSDGTMASAFLKDDVS